MIHSARARAGLLGLVALVAVGVAVALTRHSGGGAKVNPAGEWYTALAAAYAPTGKKTACGVRVKPGLVGVAHPVLPCGVKIFLSYRGRQVLTQVIDRGQVVPGREFELTRPLARLLGLRGGHAIRWRFAR